jgi:putative ABC transport system permease protein
VASLSYRTAARIATRELHSSRGKFTFVVLSVAIGVAALTGVRGFSASFRTMLSLRARSIMAGDLSAKTTQQPTPAEQAGLDRIAAEGVDSTQVTELNSMASAAGSLDPLLVSVKAVDPDKYPFYGSVDVEPNQPLSQLLTPSTVAVADDLLIRLHLQLGDSIKLGNGLYRIVAVVKNEPDRLSGSFAAGPRILLSQTALDDAGLVGFGSRASRRYLFKMPQVQPGVASSDTSVSALKSRLEALLPTAQVSDYREASPALANGLDSSTAILSLMSLVALVLGAVGVAMAMRAHLQQKLDSIAIMKALGAGSLQIMKIYLLQTFLLGLAGGLLGVMLGLGVQVAFPLFLAKLLHITPDFKVDPRAVLIGLAVGLLTTLLFTLPTLLEIRSMRPILILRRAVDDIDVTFAERARHWLSNAFKQLPSFLVILVGLGFIAARVSDSALTGEIFAGALVVVLLFLFAMSWATLSLLRLFLNRTRLRLPSVVRHGLANLYRPGNPSAGLLAALGLGVMQIMTVYFVQQAAVRELHISTAANLPNVFLVDIASNEVDGVRALLAHRAEVQGTPEIVPVVSSRMLAIDGVPDAQLKLNHAPRGMFRSLNLTWSPTPDAPPPGSKVTAGQWWTAQQSADAALHPLVAVGKMAATRLNVHPGQQMTFASQDSQFTATVAAIFDTDSRHAYSRAEIVLPEPVLRGLPVVWYGGVHCDPTATAALQRALYAAFPTITVIDVAATLEVVRQVILQITYVIQFLAAFSIFAGIVILASAIAGTRFRRIREVVVLKTLGATRPRIATIFSIEFAVLGLVAALVGLVFANITAKLVLHYVLKIDYHFQPLLTLFTMLLTAALTVAAGWLASHRVLGQKPLEVLREE